MLHSILTLLPPLPLPAGLPAPQEGAGAATTGNAATEAATEAAGLAQEWLLQARDWLVLHGPGLLVQVVVFLLILLVFRFLGGLLGKVTDRALSHSRLNVTQLLREFLVNIVRKLTLAVGLLIALGSVGVDIGPVLAGIGVVGFVVGFALQETLANFAAGIMLLLYRPYDVGDVVSAGGVTGKVEKMTMVSTTFLTPDNQLQVVPNGSIWGGTITNITAKPTRRVDMVVGVGYEDDLDRAEKVLLEVVRGHEKVLADPAPVVRVHELGDSSVNFIVRPWCRTADYWDVYWDLTKAIKQRLDAEGLSIPFPQRDVHLYSGGQPLGAVPPAA